MLYIHVLTSTQAHICTVAPAAPTLPCDSQFHLHNSGVGEAGWPRMGADRMRGLIPGCNLGGRRVWPLSIGTRSPQNTPPRQQLPTTSISEFGSNRGKREEGKSALPLSLSLFGLLFPINSYVQRFFYLFFYPGLVQKKEDTKWKRFATN